MQSNPSSISDSDKDGEYYRSLWALGDHVAYQRELLERRMYLLKLLNVIPISSPYYDRNCMLVRGQIRAIDWCIKELPKIGKEEHNAGSEKRRAT